MLAGPDYATVKNIINSKNIKVPGGFHNIFHALESKKNILTKVVVTLAL